MTMGARAQRSELLFQQAVSSQETEPAERAARSQEGRSRFRRKGIVIESELRERTMSMEPKTKQPKPETNLSRSRDERDYQTPSSDSDSSKTAYPSEA